MYLFQDPRPDLGDSDKWDHLFWATTQLADREIARKLHLMLWQLRCFGAEITWSTTGQRIGPVLGHQGIWEDEDEYQEMTRRHLGPYAFEIKQLLAM